MAAGSNRAEMGAAVAAVAALLLLELAAGQTVPEILKNNGLPEGLLPATVTSYALAENGKFEVQLTSSCKAKFGSQEVSYKQSITGKLSYGKISDLGGIQAHEFFWVSVTGIEMDDDDPGVIWFKIGFLSKSLTVDLFLEAPTCNSLEEEHGGILSLSEWVSMALGGRLEVNVPDLPGAQEAGRRMLQ